MGALDDTGRPFESSATAETLADGRSSWRLSSSVGTPRHHASEPARAPPAGFACWLNVLAYRGSDRRKTRGVMAVTRRKVIEKWLGVANPVRNAISVIDSVRSRNSSLA